MKFSDSQSKRLTQGDLRSAALFSAPSFMITPPRIFNLPLLYHIKRAELRKKVYPFRDIQIYSHLSALVLETITPCADISPINIHRIFHYGQCAVLIGVAPHIKEIARKAYEKCHNAVQ
jgi:hypothetical protein